MLRDVNLAVLGVQREESTAQFGCPARRAPAQSTSPPGQSLFRFGLKQLCRTTKGQLRLPLLANRLRGWIVPPMHTVQMTMQKTGWSSKMVEGSKQVLSLVLVLPRTESLHTRRHTQNLI